MQPVRRLGVPYQGSKNQIAREIVSILPSGKRFVDLFAGGCAVTHAAMIKAALESDVDAFNLLNDNERYQPLVIDSIIQS